MTDALSLEHIQKIIMGLEEKYGPPQPPTFIIVTKKPVINRGSILKTMYQKKQYFIILKDDMELIEKSIPEIGTAETLYTPLIPKLCGIPIIENDVLLMEILSSMYISYLYSRYMG